jgi:hypothetical protein
VGYTPDLEHPVGTRMSSGVGGLKAAKRIQAGL